MGVFCMLLDKKKRYSSLLADVFNITGHKLLIASDEGRVKELYDLSRPEVLLLDISYMDFWLELLKEKRYMIPVFFINDYEEGKELLKRGFSEYNYVILPFNPLELLSKVVNLVESETSAHEIGLISLLIRLIMKKYSASIEIYKGEKSCQIYVKDGEIKGLGCSPESLLDILNSDYKLRLDVYNESKVKIKYSTRDNWELLSAILAPQTKPVVSVAETHMQEEERKEVLTYLSQPVEIVPNLFWVGAADREGLLQKNSYLYIFSRDDLKVPVLINVWTNQDYSQIKAKVEEIIGNIEAIRAIIVLGSSVDECVGVVNFLLESKKAYVITSLSISHRLRMLGIPKERIRIFETFPDGRLKLATGNILRFIHTPFLPEIGSFLVFEEGKGYLFTGRFLSSFSTLEEFNPRVDASLEDLLLYNSLAIPPSNYLIEALKKIKSIPVNYVFPAYGNPLLSSQKVKELLDRLELLKLVQTETGMVSDREVIMNLCSFVLEEISKSISSSEFQSIVEELSPYVEFQNGLIKELFVNPETLPPLIISTLFEKGVNPKVIKEVLHRFYSARVPFTI